MFFFLPKVVTANKEKVEIKESRAAQNLFKKVNSMISKLDTVLDGLEKHEKMLIEQVKQLPEEEKDKLEKIDQLVHIDELMLAIKQVITKKITLVKQPVFMTLSMFVKFRSRKFPTIRKSNKSKNC